MINKRDLAALQLIAAAIIFFTASWPEVKLFFSHAFPYADVVIPAGAIVLLFQAFFFVYRHYLWKLDPQTAYLGGQWVYRTNKKTDFEPTSLHAHNGCFYGVFEILHTADELLVTHGKAWYCNEAPSFENVRVIWNASAIVYRDNRLWVVGDIVSDEPNRPRLTQLAVLTVLNGRHIEMEGTIWGVADQNGQYAYAFTEMRRISKRPREDAAQEAYKIYRSS